METENQDINTSIQKKPERAWKEQHARLCSLGYSKLRQNLKWLRIFDGDVDQTVEAYKLKEQVYRDLLKQKGFESQAKYLQENGVTQVPLKKIFKVLVKCNGIQEQALALLKGDTANTTPAEAQVQSNQDLSQLMHSKKLEKLLKKHGNDISAVRTHLLSRFPELPKYEKEIHQLRQEEKYQRIPMKKLLEVLTIAAGDLQKAKLSLNARDRKHWKRGCHREKKENIVATLDDKILQQFTDKGFTDLKKVQKALAKCDGKVQEALELLEKKCGAEGNLRARYPNQSAYLLDEKKVQSKAHKILRLLDQFAGDADKVLNTLTSDDYKKEDLKLLKNIVYAEQFSNQQEIECLVVDGNNLLYAEEQVRRLSLGAHGRRGAESAIIAVTRTLAKTINCKRTVLVFDGKCQAIEEQGFKVCSAKPDFAISDDFISNFAEQGGAQSSNAPLHYYVTSDRHLQTRIYKNNAQAQIMKSGQYFKCAKNLLGQEAFDNLVKI